MGTILDQRPQKERGLPIQTSAMHKSCLSALFLPHTSLWPPLCWRSQPLNQSEYYSGNLGWSDLIF
ncbi:Hypothetical predicted protein [Lynx pardinus]|uniref:Uncharacterized protein n=1 Tax=Lynx pardinus TaxID=191816 RepID=A0A485PES1_LYNPA|nr:Hypothetical predicted protein [Lynx pardinus]